MSRKLANDWRINKPDYGFFDPKYVTFCLTLMMFCHHHHHHVQEGIGLIPVSCKSSKWNWSLHLLLGRPMCLRPFGLYCSACFGILFVSILCMCCSHFSCYCFISFTIFSAPVFFPNTNMMVFCNFDYSQRTNGIDSIKSQSFLAIYIILHNFWMYTIIHSYALMADMNIVAVFMYRF